MREHVLAQLGKISGCEGQAVGPRLEDGVVSVPIFLFYIIFDPKGNYIYAVLPST